MNSQNVMPLVPSFFAICSIMSFKFDDERGYSSSHYSGSTPKTNSTDFYRLFKLIFPVSGSDKYLKVNHRVSLGTFLL